MTRVQELEQLKGFAAPNLTQQNSIGPVPKRRLQKISNGHRTNTVLFLARFEANELRVIQLDFSGVLNEQNAFVFRNEFGANSERSGFSRAVPPLMRTFFRERT
jgi:hypothetical protein